MHTFVVAESTELESDSDGNVEEQHDLQEMATPMTDIMMHIMIIYIYIYTENAMLIVIIFTN